MENMYLKKIKVTTMLYLVLALCLILFSLSLILTYAFPQSHQWTKRFASHSLYPLTIVKYNHFISFRELGENVASVRKFYESQDFSKIGLRVDFSTEEGERRLKVREKEVLNKMIEDEAIKILAQERGISVTEEMAKQGVARKLDEYGSSKNVKESLSKLYGWSLEDFEKKIVLPSLYEEELVKRFMAEVDTKSAAKAKIDEARKMLSDKNFSEVAKQFSEGETAEKGGELGWFTLEDLAPELRSPVALQKVGVPGETIESALGYHIVMVDEIKKDRDKQLYRLRQIFARKEMFSDWLTEEMRTMPVMVLSKDYYWNKQDARVEFKSADLKKFEEELYKKSAGDAMFYF